MAVIPEQHARSIAAEGVPSGNEDIENGLANRREHRTRNHSYTAIDGIDALGRQASALQCVVDRQRPKSRRFEILERGLEPAEWCAGHGYHHRAVSRLSHAPPPSGAAPRPSATTCRPFHWRSLATSRENGKAVASVNPSTSLQNAFRVSASSIAAGVGAMKATATSPQFGSGTPTTAASRTAGWLVSTASISCGYMLKPPLISISLLRPANVIRPLGSRYPRSPETAKTVPDHLRGLRGPVPVATRDVLRTNSDFANLAVADALAIRRSQRDLDKRVGPADATDPQLRPTVLSTAEMLLWTEQRNGHHCFGLAVVLREDGTKAIERLFRAC